MGIAGLLPALEEITKSRHIKNYAGQKVAIDAYCWLHKEIHKCATEMARGYGLEKLITLCIQRLQMMLSFDVIPVVIFDGGKLIQKKHIEKGREENRRRHREEADAYLAKGDEAMAMSKFSASIDITP